ncbi:hypothetical protein SISNIDRAFT_430420 [Sistotremastrum niveocremeum HHB9708]|uniref:MYND-type domain-containing protein n=1 Tax=Sistotremastrum niveocremeum HHB9708 TaxID=1314777 RepID=A0A164RUR8_9AGAM|nr:hypothetical protein SISNIDRAFT_430420 [Sistotremastrum niveocremeum HHB9708]
MKPKIPEAYRNPEAFGAFEGWVQGFLFARGKDVKHSEAWKCSVCGEQKSDCNVASWIHLPQPKVNLYIFTVCDLDKRSCYEAIQVQRRMMSTVSGVPYQPPMFAPKPPGVQFPLAGSCAMCEKDATASPDAGILRCSGCKLTRYCGAVCQKNDWSRHKAACKAVKDVQWVGLD